MKRIKLEDHQGYQGFGAKKTNLRNGEIGIGTAKNGEKILVVCCNNCGDYSHVGVEEILNATKKGR